MYEANTTASFAHNIKVIIIGNGISYQCSNPGKAVCVLLCTNALGKTLNPFPLLLFLVMNKL